LYDQGMNGINDGILIVVEGIDGAGKTTLVKRLESAFVAAGEDVVSSHEPTNGRWGTLLRQSAQNGRMELQQELDLFVRDRHDHMERLVKPALAAGKIVILDRYFYSTIAYQGARGADVSECERRMREWFPSPDAVFLVDVHPQVGLERISVARGETPNHFERADALAEVRRIFNQIAQSDSLITRVDGHLPADKVYTQVVHAMLDGVLKSKRCAKPYDCDVLYCSYRKSGECQWWETRKQVQSHSVA
jgi:dTMP kinase